MPQLIMTRPAHFEVSYHINPWMRPSEWEASRERFCTLAQRAWWQLHDRLSDVGVEVAVISAQPGMPDLVFPANAAVVLDGRALLARFANSERRVEEPVFRDYFEGLRREGVLRDVGALPGAIIQEGAGDCLWDGNRELFWAGFGQRSQRESASVIADYFACDVQALELVDERFYHLDVALAVLGGGELLYYPPAFSREARAAIRERVPAELLIEATDQEALQFNINTISIGRELFLTPTSTRLRDLLRERGYHLNEIDLSPFLLAGGAAACLTLRLDYVHHSVMEGKPHAYCNGSDRH